MTDDALFSAVQRRALVALLDEIIPPRLEADLAGAGALGVDAHVVEAVRQRPEMVFGIAPGLDALERAAAARGAGAFADLAPADRSAVLEEVSAVEAALIPTLMFLAYTGYYHHPRVVTALGLEPRPPHPKGYELPPNDLTLLDPVRRRPKLYRDV